MCEGLLRDCEGQLRGLEGEKGWLKLNDIVIREIH